MRLFYSSLLIAGLGIGTLCITGCSSNEETAATEEHVEEHADDHDHGNDHGGWWCVEHGVPEGECALCDVSLVSAFKEKGDWCEEHDRPDSQCFACNPENSKSFAERYEAKFGEQPPEPTE